MENKYDLKNLKIDATNFWIVDNHGQSIAQRLTGRELDALPDEAQIIGKIIMCVNSYEELIEKGKALLTALTFEGVTITRKQCVEAQRAFRKAIRQAEGE